MTTTTDPTEVTLIKIGADGDLLDCITMDVHSARACIHGFLGGGSAVTVVNGGYRIVHPTGETWDFVDTNVIHALADGTDRRREVPAVD